MKWEADALKKTERIPFFVRKPAMAEIEKYAAEKGLANVTVEAVDGAKKSIFNKTGTDTKKLLRLMKDVNIAEAPRPPGGIGGNSVLGLSIPTREAEEEKKNLYEVSGCDDDHLCPFSLLDARGLIQKLDGVLKESGITDELINRIEGPVVSHHAFRASVAECPNACSQPQIKDFGVIVESLPGKGEGNCVHCGLCVQECREAAIVITEAGPVIDYNKCVRCGACAPVCPVAALVIKKTGYSVLIGGRLGRHPKFGVRILEMADAEAVVRALKAVVRVYLQKGGDNERFGAMLDRLGVECIKEG